MAHLTNMNALNHASNGAEAYKSYSQRTNAMRRSALKGSRGMKSSANWSWSCHNCIDGSSEAFSYNFDDTCHHCGHYRCDDCTVWAGK